MEYFKYLTSGEKLLHTATYPALVVYAWLMFTSNLEFGSGLQGFLTLYALIQTMMATYYIGLERASEKTKNIKYRTQLASLQNFKSVFLNYSIKVSLILLFIVIVYYLAIYYFYIQLPK